MTFNWNKTQRKSIELIVINWIRFRKKYLPCICYLDIQSNLAWKCVIWRLTLEVADLILQIVAIYSRWIMNDWNWTIQKIFNSIMAATSQLYDVSYISWVVVFDTFEKKKLRIVLIRFVSLSIGNQNPSVPVTPGCNLFPSGYISPCQNISSISSHP